MKRFFLLTLAAIGLVLASCATPPAQLTLTDPSQGNPVPVPTDTPQANMPNPASAFCVEQGYTSEIRSASDGSQFGVCIFPDGSECDEWAFFRGECTPVPATPSPTEIPTALPVDPAGYEGWWTYTHAVYGFSILLPQDWVVDESAAGGAMLNGHILNLHPSGGAENIRLTFRRAGEEVLLWPTGVGQGEFIEQGALDIAGQPARRFLLVCPTGEVTSLWYHGAEESQPNITRGDTEFGILYSAGSHCEPGQSLGGKVQLVGEMIIASLKVP